MQTNVFFGRNFTKFQPEKYDFNLYKEFSWKKWPKFTRFQGNYFLDLQFFTISSSK